MTHDEDEHVKPVGGRMPIVMACDDGEPGVDCLALPPVGMSLADARREIDKAWVNAIRSNDEPIKAYLHAVGFTFHEVAMWYEQQDGYDKWGDGEDDELDNDNERVRHI